MTIKNDLFGGGTDWAAGDVLAAADLNDTFDSAYNEANAYTDQEAAFKLLGSDTLTVAGSSMSVASLDTDSYAALVVLFVLEANASNGCSLRINNDSGSNYHYRTTVYDGSTADQTGTPGSEISLGNYTTGAPFGGRLHISQNQGTWFPIIVGQTFDQGSVDRNDIGGSWDSTAEITRIDLIAASGSFQIGSRMFVYGVKSS